MKLALWLVAALAALLLAVLGAIAWIVGTEPGTRWALQVAVNAGDGKLVLNGASGTLARGVMLAELSYSEPTFQLRGEQLELRAALGRVFAGQLVFERLAARTLQIALLRDDKRERPVLPQRIALPFRLVVEQLEVDRLEIHGGAEPFVLRALAGAYAGGEHHRVRGLHFQSSWGRIALEGEMQASAPFALSASGSIGRPDARYPVGAGFTVRGNAERLDADLTLSVGPDVVSEGRAAITPFAEQRLAGLQMQAVGVDLSRFNAVLPRTALDIDLDARETSASPLAGSVLIRNRLEGRETGRLPLASLAARFFTDFRAARLEDLKLVLSGGASLAGRADVDPQRARLALRSPEGLDADVRVLLERPTLPFEASVKLARFDPARVGPYPSGALSGSVMASGALRGPRELDVRWSLADSVLRERTFRSRGSARVSEQRVARLEAQARIGVNALEARGAWGHKGDQLQWTIDAARLDEVDPRLAGRLRAKGTLSGAWGSALVSGSARASELVLPGGLTAKSLTASGTFGQKRDAALAVEFAAVAARAGNVFLDRLSGRITGTREKHGALLRALGKEFDVQADLRGGWREPDGWVGEMAALTNRGTYPLRLISPVRLQLAPGSLSVGRFDAALGDGRLLVHDLALEGERFASRGEFSGLPARWLLVPAGLGERLRSSLLLEGHWAIASAPRLTGQVSLRRASGDVTLVGEPAQELGLKRLQLDARFVEGQLGAHIQADTRFGALSLQGEVSPVQGAEWPGFTPQSPMSFKARFDFAEIRALAAPYLTQARFDGRLMAELQGSGTLEKPLLKGTLAGDALRVEVPPHGVYLRDGRLRARLEGDTLVVSELMLRGGEGELVASGTLPLSRNGERRLLWKANELRLLARPDTRLQVSGNGRLRFDGERFRLTGEARADRAHIELAEERLPQLGSDVVVIGRPRENAREMARTPLELDMDLDLGEDFTLRGRGFDGKLRGRVRVVGRRDGSLLAYGKVRASDATYLAYGRKLEVDPGALIFDGPIENPALDITAWRRKQAVEAGVQITGTAQAPNVRLVSKPNVPEGERLSWLVLGRAPTDASGADIGLLQTAAGALLGRGSSVPVTDRIARAAGLDEFGLRGGGELSQQVFAVGKRLSDRLYVSYEQGLGATATNLVKLDFALTERLSLRGETGTSSGWGLFYRFSWD